MNKKDSLKLRTGDVIEVSHGYKNSERYIVTGPARTSKCRGARIPVKRQRDDAEYTVYSSRVIGVVSINAMPTPAEGVKF